MSDRSARIAIEFTIMGRSFKEEWLLNWSPGPGDLIDPRIAQWFDLKYREALVHRELRQIELDRIDFAAAPSGPTAPAEDNP